MSSGGFFSSLFGTAKAQSGDVYGTKAKAALVFYLVFALVAVAVPVMVVVGISVLKIAGVFE